MVASTLVAEQVLTLITSGEIGSDEIGRNCGVLWLTRTRRQQPAGALVHKAMANTRRIDGKTKQTRVPTMRGESVAEYQAYDREVTAYFYSQPDDKRKYLGPML